MHLNCRFLSLLFLTLWLSIVQVPVLVAAATVHHNTHHPSGAYVQNISVFLGTRNLTKSGASVYGSVIMTDYLGELQRLAPVSAAVAVETDASSSASSTSTDKDKEKDKGQDSEHVQSKAQLAVRRREKMQAVMRALPFPVAEWPPVRVRECPSPMRRVKSHGTAERGLSMAHMQILLEFVYFDYDVQQAYYAVGPDTSQPAPVPLAKGSVYRGTDYSAVSGRFVAVGPSPGAGKQAFHPHARPPSVSSGVGSSSDKGAGAGGDDFSDEYYQSLGPGLYKNGIPFRDDDIMVIFEDDVEIAIRDVAGTLREEFNDMQNVDLLYLGWCEGRTARPVPLCAHAYAITRAGARQMVKYFEPCGHAYDWQLVTLVRNKWLRFRTAHLYSYQGNYLDGWGNGFTRGIFQQSAGQGSFNGHGRKQRRRGLRGAVKRERDVDDGSLFAGESRDDGLTGSGL